MSYAIEFSSQVNNRTGIVVAAGQLLAANENRRVLIVQNIGINPLFVKLGEDASTTDFDFVLSPGTANDDGLGGIMSTDTLSYTGVISVAGASVRCTATEI